MGIVKPPKPKRKLPERTLLIVMSVICAVLMVISLATDWLSVPASSAVGTLVVPFQEGISAAGAWIRRQTDRIAEIRGLLDENERLQEQVAELTEENLALRQDKYDLETLRTLYELDGGYRDYPKTGARIIARDTGNWYRLFTIDKGALDGIKPDMNVLATGSNLGGLAGRVVSVGPHYATVRAIISDDSNVSCQTLAGGLDLIVSGDLEAYAGGVIRFSQLMDADDTVGIGDKVVTSDISDKFLPGILVGYVDTIQMDSNKLTKSGTIRPAVGFDHIDTVLVITTLKQDVSVQ